MVWPLDWFVTELSPNHLLTVLAIIGAYHIYTTIRKRPLKDRSTQTFHASTNLKQAAASSLFGDDIPVTNWPKEAKRQRLAANRAGRRQPVTIAQHRGALVGVFPSEDLTVNETDVQTHLRPYRQHDGLDAPPSSA